MNTEKELIRLYRTRTFGDKLSDALDFVRENWRVLLKYITYLLLPVALVQTFCMNNFMSGYMSAVPQLSQSDLEAMLPWMTSMVGMILVQYVGIMLVVALTYTMMQLYEQRPRLHGVEWADLGSGVRRMVLRMVVLLLTGFVLSIVLGLLMVLMMALSPLMILPAILLMILAIPLFALTMPIYLFEDISIVGAYAKSVRLGWKTWAGIVGVIIVLYLLVSIVQSVVSMPWYLMLVVKQVLLAQGNETGFVSSFGYSAIQYVLGVIASFCGSCLMVLPVVGLAYQYGHACDKVDGVGVDQDIENFEALKVE